MSLAEIALLSLVNRFGSDATAAYGAVNQVVNYVQFPAISIAITASILGAQAIGADRADRLGAITRTGLLMNLVLTGALVVIGYLFSRHLSSLFITSAPVVDLAQSLLHIMLWSSVVYGCAAVVERRDARLGHGADADGDLDPLHPRDRGPVGLRAGRALRHLGRLDGLSDRVRLDARAAGNLLPAGLEESGRSSDWCSGDPRFARADGARRLARDTPELDGRRLQGRSTATVVPRSKPAIHVESRSRPMYATCR